MASDATPDPSVSHSARYCHCGRRHDRPADWAVDAQGGTGVILCRPARVEARTGAGEQLTRSPGHDTVDLQPLQRRAKRLPPEAAIHREQSACGRTGVQRATVVTDGQAEDVDKRKLVRDDLPRGTAVGCLPRG